MKQENLPATNQGLIPYEFFSTHVVPTIAACFGVTPSVRVPIVSSPRSRADMSKMLGSCGVENSMEHILL